MTYKQIPVFSRFTVTSTKTTTEDIIKDWTEIRHVATEILSDLNTQLSDRAKVPLKGKYTITTNSYFVFDIASSFRS